DSSRPARCPDAATPAIRPGRTNTARQPPQSQRSRSQVARGERFASDRPVEAGATATRNEPAAPPRSQRTPVELAPQLAGLLLRLGALRGSLCQGERSVQLHDGCLFEKGVARPSPELVGVRLC